MNNDQFAAARVLAGNASWLDFAKNSFPQQHRADAAACVRQMHDLAEALAGERAAEIYGREE